ncbi:GntP family permease [Salinifilum ghardaiensis]
MPFLPAHPAPLVLAQSGDANITPAWDLPDWALVLSVAGGIALLLVLVLALRLHAFVALLVVSMFVALASGIPLNQIPTVLENGMGEMLGSFAIIVALGAMLGRVMEQTGGAQALAERLLTLFGEHRAPLAMGVTALVVGIPLFPDVGFILLLPLVYAVAANAGRSLISIALPTLGALAMLNAVLPPHPGPVAAAELFGANLGWLTIMGLLCGLPAWFFGSYLFGKWIGDRTFTPVPEQLSLSVSEEAGQRAQNQRPPSLPLTVTFMVLPVVLILLNTFSDVFLPDGPVRSFFLFIGDPISALTISTLLAFWILARRSGFTLQGVEKAASASLGPVAMVLLVTGAGGVFGAVLEATEAGDALANAIGSAALPPTVLAFLVAAVLRVALGSKTVAIVTTAPIISPFIESADLSQPETALIVIAVAGGGTVLSHVNDSGFWLFNRYLDLDVRSTLKTWTLMETIMGALMFLIALVISIGITAFG